ncbi:hypothetical protein D3C80_1183330 [compost metagenome]
MQVFQQLIGGARGVRAELRGVGNTLAQHQLQRLFVAQAGQPGMSGRGVEQRRVAPHVRVVAQAGARALGFDYPGQAVAVDHAQAHQLAGFLGQAIEDRLDDVCPAAGQIAEGHGHQPGGQLVAAVLLVLAYVAEADQLRKHAVGGALGDVQLVRQALHGQAAGIAGEAFEEVEGAFDLAAGHGR